MAGVVAIAVAAAFVWMIAGHPPQGSREAADSVIGLIGLVILTFAIVAMGSNPGGTANRD